MKCMMMQGIWTKIYDRKGSQTKCKDLDERAFGFVFEIHLFLAQKFIYFLLLL